MLYRVVDIRKAIYEVDDLAQAVSYVYAVCRCMLVCRAHTRSSQSQIVCTLPVSLPLQLQRHSTEPAEAHLWRHVFR